MEFGTMIITSNLKDQQGFQQLFNKIITHQQNQYAYMYDVS